LVNFSRICGDIDAKTLQVWALRFILSLFSHLTCRFLLFQGAASAGKYYGGEVRQDCGGRQAVVVLAADTAGLSNPREAVACRLLQKILGWFRSFNRSFNLAIMRPILTNICEGQINLLAWFANLQLIFFSRDSSGCQKESLMRFCLNCPWFSYYDLATLILPKPRNAGVMEIAQVMGFMELCYVVRVRMVG